MNTEKGREAVKANWSILSPSEQHTAQLLLDNDQGHLFAHWEPPGHSTDADKHRFLTQCALIEQAYLGGLRTYVTRARTLLAAAQSGANPYEGYLVREPSDSVRIDSPEAFHHYEAIGMSAVKSAAFVLVAGGLGERLGYAGIKLALPSEIITETCFLALYAKFLLALQKRTDREDLPLGIMTSDDTHEMTEKLLKQHQYFGLKSEQVTLFKQGKVPSMIDSAAHFTVEEKDPFALDTKPHGHGDVHMLLYQQRIIHDWVNKKNRKYLVFFQDTNVLVFRALIAGLGASVEKHLQVNSLTVPRVQGDAVGAICKLVRDPNAPRQPDAEKLADVLTMSVEYNQLEGLMGKGAKEPLVPGTKSSVYPGNINVLIFDAPAYLSVLEANKGVISEFVNPKYNADKKSFKKPTRLESMMQDWAKLLDKDAIVSFTEFQRWSSFSAVKNALNDAVAKQKDGNAPECGASSESDLFMWSYRVLKEAGVSFDEPKTITFKGVTVQLPGKVVLMPSFGVTQEEVTSKFVGKESIKLHNDTTLVLDGQDIIIRSMDVHGALFVHAADGAKVTIENLNIKNDGYEFVELKDNEAVDQVYQIRGYQLKKSGQDVFRFTKPGNYVLSDATKNDFRST